MGADAMSDLPPLPKGFVLDGQAQTIGVPALPNGFTLDAPQPGFVDQMKAAVTDIPGEIYSAGKSALSGITENLNPFSESRMASIDRQSKAPSLMAGLGENLSQTLGVGRGLAAVPELVTSPITGAARSAIGHPYSAMTGMPYEQAKDAVDTAMMGLKPAGASPRGLATKAAPVPSAPELKSAAVAGYDAAKNSGVELKPSALTTFSDGIKANLNADGLNEVLAPKTFGVLEKIGVAPPDAIVTTNDFRTLQRSLGHAAKSPDPTERLAASRAIEALNSHIENLSAAEISKGTPKQLAEVVGTIKEANANYAGYKRAEDFNFRGEKAQNNAAAANTGMNVENRLRSQVRQILNNKNAQRGFDAETMAAFRAFNSGSRSANIIRMIGNALGGGGGWGALAAGAAGHLAVPFIGAATPAVGMAVKAAGNARASKQFEKLGERIRANTPLARSLPPVQLPLPSPLAGPAIPYQFSNGLPIFRGAIPAYADQDQPRRR